MYYVYEWFVIETGEIFYVGKGCRKRYSSLNGRNKLFEEYINTRHCKSRIIKRFDDENTALKYEHDRICYLKSQGQCSCNLDNGGKGGLSFIWTDEMRHYKSVYNPMKSEEQRARMSKSNPMKNKQIAKKVNGKKARQVIINNQLFSSIVEAGKHFDRHPTQISAWCKRGYDIDRNPCRFADEPQKEIPEKKITCSKKVIIDGITYSSVKEGAKHIGVCSETLIRAIKHGKKCKGHICEYDNQQPS